MFRLLVLFILGLLGCAEQMPGGDTADEVVTTVNFVPSTEAHDAIKLFERDGVVPVLTVRVMYPDHESEVDVGGASAEETADELFNMERELLGFLVTQFDADDQRERNIHEDLTADLDELQESNRIEVRRVIVSGEFIIEDESVESYSTVARRPEQMNLDSNAKITDYTGDASYVPEGGTSTIYTSGTLQKFWMDEDSADAFDAVSDGIEIDTLISSRSYAKCGNSTSSNMPDYYKDTEAFDSLSSYRTCAIGTISADELIESDLYWTWHSFSSFSSTKNPYILVNFQPSTWGAAVTSEAVCVALGAWCMFSRSDMPIGHLISYNYNDAKGVEESWAKD